MNMRTRKALGCFGAAGLLGVYALLAASLGVALAPLMPTWAELIFYAIAGDRLDFPAEAAVRAG